MPSWWASGVLDTSTSNPPDNWAMANIGQLKNIATKARAHLDATLGLTPADWIAAYAPDPCPLPFSTTADPDNYSPITIGQLKFIAAGFYRLLNNKAPGYDVRGRLLLLGVPSAAISGAGPYYPWSVTPSAGENYDSVTIGQLKIVFSFDLTGFFQALTADSDGDGVPDWLEIKYFGVLSATDGTQDHNGNLVVDGIEMALGINPRTPGTLTTNGDLNLKVHTP